MRENVEVQREQMGFIQRFIGAFTTGKPGGGVDSSAKDEIGQLSRSMATMIENIQSQAQAADRIAAGDLSVEIEAKSG